jgi:hypothetical protein
VIDRLFTLITIHSPELELISKKEFFFKLEQLDEVNPVRNKPRRNYDRI